MEIIKPGINIDFIGKRKLFFVFSVVAILGTFVLLVWKGPNFGVDFAGGVVIQVRLEKQQSPSEIREALAPAGLGDSIIQEFGEKEAADYLIRITDPGVRTAGLQGRVEQALSSRFGKGVEIRQMEMVGPQVGKDLREKALFAVFYSILFMAIYISGRFEHKWTMSIVMAVSLILAVYLASLLGAGVTWLIIVALLVTLGLCWFLKLKYATGAILTLLHDVIVTVGALVLTDREFSLSTIAALLTLVGYSINDTIVVYDRIRENLGKHRKMEFEPLMNRSINETLSRTLLTGSTTLVVLLVLFLMGGPVIHDFIFALLAGIIIGTYSSIYISCPALLLWEAKSS